jgi:antirestriction protein ArdC
MNQTNNRAADLAANALRQLSDALAEGDSAALTSYLATMAKFHNYSFNNVLLILSQRPDATHVAGFNRWKEMGRYVRKGEKGIAILAPSLKRIRSEEQEDEDTEAKEQPAQVLSRFVTVHVFDVIQTDGEPLPELSRPTGHVGCHLLRLRDLVLEKGIGLAYADYLGGAMGVSYGNSIAILRGLEPAEELTVTAHELAHELLHRGERRIETTRQIRELEAEAVAYVVGQACGVETHQASWDYIRLYGGDEKLLAQSLGYVQRVAAEVLDFLL